MGNYKQTSTGAMADVDFSKEVEEENRKAREAYEDYLKRAMSGEKVTLPKIVNKKEGGSVCSRPTGKGFGKARKR
jgi:hypothetical protein